jgi:transcriptional regulator with XRE-family HTH domain
MAARYSDDAWRKRLRAAVRRHWKKHWAIAEAAGVTPATLSRIITSVHVSPRLDSIVRIARAVEISVGRDLLDERGFELTDGELKAVTAGVAALKAALARARPPQHDARASPNAWRMKGAQPTIPSQFRKAGARLVYHAAGDSMLPAGIADGDMLFVRPCSDLHEAQGSVVVAELGGEFYVKRLAIRAATTFLESANERYAPIEVDDGDRSLRIVGIVVGRMLTFE